MEWFTVAGVVAVLVSYFAIRRKAKARLSPRAEYGQPMALTPSLESFVETVASLVAAGEMIVDRAVKAGGGVDALGPVTRAFFAEYPSLRSKSGGLRLTAADVHPSQYVAGFISIGNSEDWDIVQRPGDDQVYVVEGSERHPHEFEVSFLTVYHLVLNEVHPGRKGL